MSEIRFSVFTKPWKDPIDQLGERVAGMGFHGIELPVRPGYPVIPEKVNELPAAVRRLKEHGIEVFSIAGPTDEATFAACAESGIPTVRVMAPIRPEGYLATEEQIQREYDGLLPLLEKYRITIGVQESLRKLCSQCVWITKSCSQIRSGSYRYCMGCSA